MRARRVVAVAAVLAAAAACQGLIDIRDRSHGASGADAGATEAGADGDTARPACLPQLPPEPPALADDPNDDVDLTFALDRLTIDDPNAGYDLDRQCTCQGDSDEGSCRGHRVTCDVDGGRGVDNALAQIFRVASAANAGLGNSSPENVQRRILAGEFTVVARVQRYNGVRNDRRLRYITYVSNGTVMAVDDAGLDAGTVPLSTDGGENRMTIDPASVRFPDAAVPWDQPTEFNDDAYIRDETLVVKIGRGRIGFGELQMDVTDATLTGRLLRSPWRIEEGRITGRLATSTFLRALGAIQPGGQGSYVCPGSAAFEVVKVFACPGQDIRSDPQLDNRGQDCDALSFGLGFHAVSATIVGVRARDPVVNGCADASPDAYACDPPPVRDR
jgi:hypothetical protein